MPFHKLTISQTFIESKSFGRTGNQLSVGTLCLRAFQMLDLKGGDSSHGQAMAEGELGPLHSVMRQEALPMAIRLLGANFHSQESIVSFSNILTDIKLNPSKFLGLAVNLINLLKSQDSGSPAARPDDEELQHLSQTGVELRRHSQDVKYLQQHFNSCQNIVEVLLCLYKSSTATFCTSDAAGGLLDALQDMLLECTRVFKIYAWCQEHMVTLENERTGEVTNVRRKSQHNRRENTAAEDLAEFRRCARSCAHVAELITFEATRLIRLINSISQLTPEIIKDFFLEIQGSTRPFKTTGTSLVGIFCSVLHDLLRDANTFFRDHRLPENERVDFSYILKGIVAANLCSLVCIHHITSSFPIEMNQIQVYKFSVCAFTAISSGVQFLSHPTKDRRVKKLAAFKDVADMKAEDIVPLKTVLETLIICILLNLAHAAHTGEVPVYVSQHDFASNANAAPSRFGMLAPITHQHREILNQLLLWCVRGGGMVAAAAVLVASFAQVQLFLPHRLIVRVLLQKTSFSESAEEFIAMSQCELEDVNADAVLRMRQRNLPSVEFLRELIRWIDPSYAAQALPLSSQLSSQASSLELPKKTTPELPLPSQLSAQASSLEQSGPSKSSSSAASSLFNVNRLPTPLQVRLHSIFYSAHLLVSNNRFAARVRRLHVALARAGEAGEHL
jgi:hypothetical protein